MASRPQHGADHNDQYFHDEPLDDHNDDDDDDDDVGFIDFDGSGGGNGTVASTSTTTTFEFDGVQLAMSKEERRRLRRRKRNERTGKIVVACLCVCLLIGGVIAIILTREAQKVYRVYVHPPSQTEAPSASPTPPVPPKPTMPTLAPTVKPPSLSAMTTPPHHGPTPPTNLPTYHPTVTPTVSLAPSYGVQNQYVFLATTDTYIYVDGPDVTRSFGVEDVFVVRHGSKQQTKPGEDVQISTAYSFVQFNNLHKGSSSSSSSLPMKERWDSADQDTPILVTLELSHIPLNTYLDDADIEDHESIVVEIYMIPPPTSTTKGGFKFKSLTGESYNAAKVGTTGGGYRVGSKLVHPNDKQVSIDITLGFAGTGGGDGDDDTSPPFVYNDEDTVTFLLKVQDGSKAGPPQRIADRFISRDMPVSSMDDPATQYGPYLVFNNMA
jgi:hypothetical protein